MSGEVKAPTEYISDFIIISGNSVRGNIPPSFPQTTILGVLMRSDNDSYDNYWLIYDKYPDIADSLVCLWREETKYGRDKFIRGDNGRAYGDFQIWISVNDITEDCAMNFSCALDWTVKEIKAGNSWKWPPFTKCS